MGLFDDTPTQKQIENAKEKMLCFPIIISASKKNVIFLLVGLVVTYFSVEMIYDGMIEAFLILAFGILIIMAGIWSLSPNGNRLEIDKDGFEYKTIFKTNRVNWNEIEDLGTWKYRGGKYIVWNWNKEAIASGKRKVPVGSSFFGFHIAMRNFYAIELGELLALMALTYNLYGNNNKI